ncbi:putative glutathione transferase [Lupinus albus]|uniref:Putative glutathione transferase n=1 Tax=Lupinus albus TaxID=3870 RepID=A0A6A4P7E7_LUPAL|nr:putative glutathione transferase [Lupinus albus]
MVELKVYANRMSQPSRALVIFCKPFQRTPPLSSIHMYLSIYLQLILLYIIIEFEDTKTATNPHFEEVHNILYKAKKNFELQRLRVAKNGTEPNNKVGVHSKM